MQTPPPLWVDWLLKHPPFFLVIFVAMWASMLYLISAVSGWNALSKRFRLQGRFYGETRPFRSARLRFYVHFGNCLDVGADESGLYLAVLPIFRFGHPPLLIPWPEVSVISGETGFIFKKRELRLGRQESIPLRISASLAEDLRTLAGDSWPVDAVAV